MVGGGKGRGRVEEGRGRGGEGRGGEGMGGIDDSPPQDFQLATGLNCNDVLNQIILGWSYFSP